MTTEQPSLPQKSNYYSPSSDELLELIEQVQRGSILAKHKLCEYFTPLVESTARKYIFYSVLGEDSVSIAWLIFLEFIESYKVKKAAKITPGYFQKVIYSKLIEQVEITGSYNSHLNYEIDTTPEAIIQSFEEEYIKDQILAKSLKTLKPKELRLIYLYFFAELTLVEIAALTQDKVTKYWSLKARVLQKLRITYLSYLN